MDMARGIGILLVVMGHVEFYSLSLRRWLSLFHMPLFFLLSGVLAAGDSQRRPFGEYVRRRARRIMIPYGIFSALTLGVEILWALWRGRELADVAWYLYQTLCLQGFSALWFLPALFLSQTAFEGLRRLLKGPALGAVLLAGAGAALWLKGPEALWYLGREDQLWARMLHEIFEMLLRVPVCTGFVGLGYGLGRLSGLRYGLGKLSGLGYGLGRLSGQTGSPASPSAAGCAGRVLAGCALLGLTAWIAGQGEMTDLRSLTLGNPLLYGAGAAAGSVGVLLLCQGLAPLAGTLPGRFLRYLGVNSLTIMATHLGLRVLSTGSKLALWAGGGDPEGFWWKPLILGFTLLLEIPLIEAVNRWFPLLAGRGRALSGGGASQFDHR